MASPVAAEQLHAVLIPIPSQSHLIPISSLSLLLSPHGLTVTLLLPPLPALRSHPLLSRHSIRLLPLPSLTDPDLPSGLQTLNSLPSPELRTRFLLACNSLREPVHSILRALRPPPSFIVSSFLWTSDLAAEFGIPRFYFGTISCFTLFTSHQIHSHGLIDNGKPDLEPFVVPGLPHRVEFTDAQLPLMLRGSANNADGKSVRDHFARSIDCSDGILINTFEDLETDYCKLYRDVKENVFCIGPLSLMAVDDRSDDDHSCLKWLDSAKEPGSVIYVCFGSLARILPRQMVEIGLGLMNSNRPFVWVVREADFGEELDFVEERLNGRGLVVRGWAPQVVILSHVAVGGFVSHCGWNSVLEAVCAGVPMVTWPMFAEQFYNEKFVVDVLRVGVRVGVEVSIGDGDGDGDVEKGFVTREKVERAVEELMGDGEEGGGRRRRAEELRKAARMAAEEGGSSDSNMTLFIEHVNKKLSERGLKGT